MFIVTMDASDIKIPPHVLVQRHLQEVVAALKEENERLKKQLDGKDDYIPREELEETANLLEDERLAHSKTRSELMETQDKLAFALGEVEILRRQLEREKQQFEQTFGALKKKSVKETIKKVELESKCLVKDLECEQKDELIDAQEDQMCSLNQKLTQQKAAYKHQLSEMNVQLQQELYIAKLNEQKGKSKRPSKPTTVPRTLSGKT